ncbi:MAG: hypothetical protein KA206_01020 [Paludibacter sp.]|nr:hypothetical protein [Paludibacter sp.]
MKEINIRVFKNKESQHQIYSIPLMEWLVGERFRLAVEAVRAAPDKDTMDKLKLKLPCAMPSLLVDGTHSGLIAIDIDAKDNLSYTPAQLKEKVCSLSNVYYCGYSCRGRGVWALVPLYDTSKHLEHFRALETVFERIGLTIDDSCSNVNRLRFCSYDAEPYFNDDAVPFRLVPAPEAPKAKIKLTSPDFVKGKNIFDEFNQKADVVGLLTNHGWKKIREVNDRIMLTRPDKQHGISGEYSTSLRLFYCYTGSAQFEPKRAYNAVQLLSILECNEDIKRTAKAIKQLIK